MASISDAPASTERHGERRRDPRFPLDATVTLHARGGTVHGRTVDASASGLLVELTEPLPFLDHQVAVEIVLGSGSAIRAEGDVVRRGLSTDGDLLVAVRFVDDAGGRELIRQTGLRPLRDYRRRRRPSRAKPRAPRPAIEIRGELRALGARVLELALAEPGSPPPQALAEWVTRLATELGVPPGSAASNRSLLREIARLHVGAARPEPSH
jgi:hypothetical protein